MHPILFSFGKFTIYTYGFFMAMAFLSGILIGRHEGKRLGVSPEQVMDAVFYIILSAIIGARLFYVATNIPRFAEDPLEAFRIWNGGLVFYGGFIAAAITTFFYVRVKKIPFGKAADIGALSVAIGYAVARLGCFSAGCCYGKPCDLPWAVTFTNPDSLAPLGIPLHPTEIYSSITLLIIFCVLMFLRKHLKISGQLFWIYVLIYGLSRSLIEILRGDPRGGFVFGVLSVSQTIGLIASFIAIFMLIYLSKRSIPHSS
jgi:phosphatidylglycerol:prolipoprotein diacylglycerol transferase